MKKSKIILALAIFIITGTMYSCSESNVGTGSRDDSVLTENLMAAAAEQQFKRESPEKIYTDFQEMLSKLESINRAEIDTLSDEKILELGAPFLKAFENTVKFDTETLKRLSETTRDANENPESITPKMHSEIAKELENILSSSISKFEKRTFDANDIRDRLTNITTTRGVIEDVFECDEYFNVQGSTVYLYQGDVFGIANAICPAGSTFNIFLGTHYGHYIVDSKNGNTWTGWNAILDGGGSTKRAFRDGMNNNTLSWLTIRNYSQNGIVSDGSDNVLIFNMTFKNIAPSYDGELNGAINFEDSQNIRVQYSDFENVAAGVLFTDSDGPLQVTNNEALNSGRNFFQCNNCNGYGIRINRNSMEHTSAYGNTTLVDFISIFKSEGISTDWIQVNNNRARTIGTGSGMDTNGSFIMLGDWGGKYQEAKNNIGVNPGQVGIGAASGNNIRVKNNKMYSKLIDGISNVAFYSWKNPTNAPNCSNHTFDDNVANWIYGKHDQPNNHGNQNIAWTDGSCGASNIENTTLDESMTVDIWNTW